MTRTTADTTHMSGAWVVVAAACLGTTVIAFNSNAVITALLAIKSSLDLDPQTLQWVVNAYMLASASLIAVMGRFADIFGKLRMFLIGAAVFSAGSLTIMAAEAGWMVLIGRACQGAGGAAVLTASAALVSVATPEEKRAAALGLWSASVGFGYGVGPLIGGYLADAFSWRWIFAVEVALLALSCLLALRIKKMGVLAESGTSGGKVDYLGVALLVLTLGAFAYGLSGGNRVGWTSLQSLSLFGTAFLAAVLFAIRERYADDPLVYFSFFRRGRYLASTLGMFVTGFLFLGVLYYYNLFVQSPDMLGFSPLEAGISLLPFTVAMFLVSLTAPRLLAQYSYQWPVTIGMLTLAAGSWLMHLTTDQSTYWDLWWKLAIIGAGVGLNFSTLPRVGLRVLSDEDAGQGAGVINTCLYVGITFGIAAGGVVMATIKHGFIGDAVRRLTSGSDTAMVERILNHGSQSQVTAVLGQFSQADRDAIGAAMRDSLDNAFAGVMEMMTLVALIGAVASFFLIRGAPPAKAG